MLQIKFMNTSSEMWITSFKWIPKNTFNDKSTLFQVMAWSCLATRHYLSQCWPRSMSPYGITRPQWVTKLKPYIVINLKRVNILDSIIATIYIYTHEILTLLLPQYFIIFYQSVWMTSSDQQRWFEMFDSQRPGKYMCNFVVSIVPADALVPMGRRTPAAYLGPRQMDTIVQMTFSNAFSWMKRFEFQ